MTVICPYCAQAARLYHPGAEGYPYPADWGPAWKCAACDAYIRCYAGTVTPLGTLADAETRHWRARAHAALDPLWQGGGESRSAVYRWLADALGVTEPDAHIGRLDPAGCRAVIRAVAGRRAGGREE